MHAVGSAAPQTARNFEPDRGTLPLRSAHHAHTSSHSSGLLDGLQTPDPGQFRTAHHSIPQHVDSHATTPSPLNQHITGSAGTHLLSPCCCWVCAQHLNSRLAFLGISIGISIGFAFASASAFSVGVLWVAREEQGKGKKGLEIDLNPLSPGLA